MEADSVLDLHKCIIAYPFYSILLWSTVKSFMNLDPRIVFETAVRYHSLCRNSVVYPRCRIAVRNSSSLNATGENIVSNFVVGVLRYMVRFSFSVNPLFPSFYLSFCKTSRRFRKLNYWVYHFRTLCKFFIHSTDFDKSDGKTLKQQIKVEMLLVFNF